MAVGCFYFLVLKELFAALVVLLMRPAHIASAQCKGSHYNELGKNGGAHRGSPAGASSKSCCAWRYYAKFGVLFKILFYKRKGN
jgi:hypothetical protein